MLNPLPALRRSGYPRRMQPSSRARKPRPTGLLTLRFLLSGLVAGAALPLTGCMTRPGHAAQTTPITASTASSGSTGGSESHGGRGLTGILPGIARGMVHGVTHPLSLLPLPKGSPPVPRALPLVAVGTVRSYSQEGNYAIIELQPGSTVRSGDRLVIPDPSTWESVRLKVGEIRYPCFDADVEKGTPSHGDTVQE